MTKESLTNSYQVPNVTTSNLIFSLLQNAQNVAFVTTLTLRFRLQLKTETGFYLHGICNCLFSFKSMYRTFGPQAETLVQKCF